MWEVHSLGCYFKVLNVELERVENGKFYFADGEL